MKLDVILNTDCLGPDGMPSLPDKSVDMILCDLPYGTTACSWDVIIPFAPLWEQYKRVIKDRGAIVLFGSQPFTSMLIMSNLKWFKYEWIWRKSKGTGHLDANKRPLKSHENICVFSNNQSIYFPQMRKGKKHHRGQEAQSKQTQVYGNFKFSLYYSDEYYPQSIISINVVENATHPTQKPVALCEYLIKTYTNEGDIVLDNCSGSGTTAVAYWKTQRHFICMEKDEQYWKDSMKRLKPYIEQRRLDDTGRWF